jgi:hypothetical protein
MKYISEEAGSANSKNQPEERSTVSDLRWPPRLMKAVNGLKLLGG